jgi:hypothetical protein
LIGLSDDDEDPNEFADDEADVIVIVIERVVFVSHYSMWLYSRQLVGAVIGFRIVRIIRVFRIRGGHIVPFQRQLCWRQRRVDFAVTNPAPGRSVFHLVDIAFGNKAVDGSDTPRAFRW